MCQGLVSSASNGALCQRWSRGMKTEVPGDTYKRLSRDRCLEISQWRKEKRKPQEDLLLSISSVLLPYLFASESKHSLFCQHKTTWVTLRKPSIPTCCKTDLVILPDSTGQVSVLEWSAPRTDTRYNCGRQTTTQHNLCCFESFLNFFQAKSNSKPMCLSLSPFPPVLFLGETANR